MWKSVAFAVIVFTIFHTAVHFFSYETELFGLNGVSGFSIRGVPIGEEIIESYPIGESVSRVFVLIEWLAVLSVIIFIFLQSRKEFNLEFTELIVIKKQNEKNGTDLDKLYEMVSKRKVVNLKTAAKVFGVGEEIAAKWGQTLEQAKLASIEYPFGGGAVLVLNK